MSLKKILNQTIKEAYPYTVSLNTIYSITEETNHKQSCAERALRPSRSSQIYSIKNEKGFIVGYRWIPQQMVSDLL